MWRQSKRILMMAVAFPLLAGVAGGQLSGQGGGATPLLPGGAGTVARPGENPFAALAGMSTGAVAQPGVNPFAGFTPVTTATIPLAVVESITLEDTEPEEEIKPEEEAEPDEEAPGSAARLSSPKSEALRPGELLTDTNQLALLPEEPATPSLDSLVGLKYENMDVEEVLSQYSDWTGLALMRAPDVPAAKITLKCPKRLPKREALLAIEGVLAMHGIALVPMGDKFLKVVQIGAARQHGMTTGSGIPEKEIADTDRLVSRIVELKHLELAEAQPIIQNLLHPYGKVMLLDRVNCLLITETALNLKRILEILAIIDQPLESREELRIFPIIYAKASEIQAKIESIISDVQAKETRTRTVRSQLTSRMPLQPFQPVTPQPSGGQPTVVDVSKSALERGLIQSKVKMVADDRINSLIVITRPEQFSFFTNIISALDRKVEPEVSIKVFSLEYADSKDVVAVLNNLLSGATSKTPTPQPTTPTRSGAPTSLFMPSATESEASAATAGRASEIQLSGKLSSEVKIIADTRINSLLVLASRVDMAVIEDVLRQLDIMLSQVLIEVAIVEIGLSDKIKVGVDWLQRSMIAYNEKQSGGRRAFLGFGGASRSGTEGTLADADAINAIADLPAGAGSGLTYYFKLFDYNIDAVINMLASSSEAKILSTPIILTTDNKQAKILVGEKRPIVTSTSISGGGVQQSSYQYTDIGIQLDVTPRINKKGFVVMDIKQKIDNTGEDVIIDGNPVPIITTRDFTASIAVNDGRTIVIGGIVSTDRKKGRSKIPFLGDIPLLGALFRTDSTGEIRRELIVLMTPYVLNTPEKAYAETARRHGYIAEATNLWTRGWSASTLAAPTAKEQRELKKKKKTPASGSPTIDVLPESPTGVVEQVP